MRAVADLKALGRSGVAIAAGVLAALFCVCSDLSMAGGGSDTEVSGRIIAKSGSGAPGAIVVIIDTSYDPATDEGIPSKHFDTTDSRGEFIFSRLQAGTYNIRAVDPLDSTQILVSDIAVTAGRSTRLDDHALKPAAQLFIVLPDTLAGQQGRVSVPGTELSVAANGTTNAVTLTGVPQGVLSSIRFRKTGAASFATLHSRVVIDSAGVFRLDPYAAWKHAAVVTLNTTVGGVNLTEMVTGFPMLLRLTAAQLDFSQARREGEDIRIVRPDGTPLPFEIEYWDSATATATVWFRADTVRPGAVAPLCRILWGNPTAKKISQPGGVFDTTDGFSGVWHLGESGANFKLDATVHGFVGTPIEMDGSSDAAGIAGRAHDFDGSSQCITVLDARNSALDVQRDSFYTVSAWVFARNLQRDNRVMVSKGSAQYGLQMNERNEWEFYGGLRGYGVDTTTTSPATIGVWTHLSGVRMGMKQYLYVNGVLADSTLVAAGTSAALSNNFYDLVIGRQSDDESAWFDGMVDEVRIESRARSAAWVYLCSESQKIGQRLVTVARIR